MSNKLPGLPKLDTSEWLFALALMVAFFYLYYTYLYPRIEAEYYESFKSMESKDGFSTEQSDINVFIYAPEYITTSIERAIVISIENQSGVDLDDLFLIISVDSKGGSVPLIVKPEKGDNATFSGAGYIRLAIPAYTAITQNIWVRVSPLSQSDFEANVKVNFYLEHADETLLMPPTLPIILTVDHKKTLATVLVETLLLPPWANGFLPMLAVLFALMWSELRRWLMTRFKGIRERSENIVEGKQNFFLSLLLLVELIIKLFLSCFFLWVLTQAILHISKFSVIIVPSVVIILIVFALITQMNNSKDDKPTT